MIKSIQMLLATAAFTMPAASIYAQTSQMPTAPAKPAPMAPGHMQKPGMGMHDMKQPMMAGMESMNKMQMTGDTDKDFAMMMKVHHQQAVDMAQMELANGKSPKMKAMAKQIISSQKKEIAQFDAWLKTQK